METKIRFGDYLKEVTVNHDKISYIHLTPKLVINEKGEPQPHKPAKLELRAMDAYRLLTPYISVRFMDQMKAVTPLAVYMGLFQYFILNQSVKEASLIGAGLFAVMIGLMLFMEGLKLGLMPFGETIGNTLPKKAQLWVVLSIAFLLGIGVTFAEPAIGALQIAGGVVDPAKAPYLYSLLTTYAGPLVLVVGFGVGLAAVLGTMRFIYNWSLKPMIYLSLIPTLILTALGHMHPEVSKIVGLAWDCGGVTTGPVTVPLVLALGIGVASAVGKGNTSLSGFGIVTLASVFPILGVLILGFFISTTVSPADILAAAQTAKEAAALAVPTWSEVTPGVEIVMGIRAIVPLVLFLLAVLYFVLKEKIKDVGTIRYGVTLAVVGMIVFNLGLTYGLAKLGDQSGSLVPGAFTKISDMSGSPLYGQAVGIGIAIIFAWCLGFGATLAEPALNALGMTVENLTNGAFKKSLLMYSVAIGVGMGIAVGVAKIIFGIPLPYILVPGYTLAIVLTYLNTEEYVNIAWDSAGVTTGPVTVPLVLAMGLGFANAVGAIEGFGILAAASLFPILAVLTSGIYVKIKSKKENDKTISTNLEEVVL
ncbi:MAG: DUF1538 domain-containing protein [Bdellovibrionales bacterium]|nr:DUF1538 domain-containing protein [Bdellovibrionales bacterium]